MNKKDGAATAKLDAYKNPDQKIVRMHVTSDREQELGLLHLSSWQPEPIGSEEEFNGKKYRVIDNSKFDYVVTYEPVKEI